MSTYLHEWYESSRIDGGPKRVLPHIEIFTFEIWAFLVMRPYFTLYRGNAWSRGQIHTHKTSYGQYKCICDKSRPFGIYQYDKPASASTAN